MTETLVLLDNTVLSNFSVAQQPGLAIEACPVAPAPQQRRSPNTWLRLERNALPSMRGVTYRLSS